MTGAEVVERIMRERTADKQFIRWWRREEDWLDYDLVDRFIKNANPNEEIGGYSLVTMEEMWDQVMKLTGPDRLRREPREGSDVVVWKRQPEAKGGEREYTCLYSPESLINILDVETRGNLVD